MFEENSRKRARESDDEYEPQAGGDLVNNSSQQHLQRNDGEQEQQQQPEFTQWSSKRFRAPQLSRAIELAKNVCPDICKLGEYPPELARDIDYVSNPIANEFNQDMIDDDFKNSILDYIYSMIIEQPHKIAIIAGLVQACNAKAGKVGSFVIDYLQFKAQGILDGLKGIENEETEVAVGSEECGKFTRLKLILRFFATLTPILDNPDSIITIFRQFLNIAIELQNSNEFRSPLAEMLYFETLLSLPYIWTSDKEDSELKAKCDELIELAKSFNIKETKFPSKIFQHFQATDSSYLPYEPKNVVRLVLPAVEKLDDDSLFLNVNVLIRPYIEEALRTQEGNENLEDIRNNAEMTVGKELPRHPLPQFNLPSLEDFRKVENLDGDNVGNVDSLWTYPRFNLEIFSLSGYGFSTVPATDTYTSLILRDVIEDLVQNMEFNRVTVSRQILILHFFFNEKLFAKPNSSIDKLTIVNDLASGVDLIKDLEENEDIPESMKASMITSAKHIQREFDEGYKSTWKMEEIVAESILNLMFNLPETQIPNMYYETLLADTCGRDWAIMRRSEDSNEKVTFAKVLGGAIRYFYKHIKYLNFELRLKFVDWITLQLSNFNFDWAWNDWVPHLKVLDGSIYHPTIQLIKNVISKEIRISSPATIKSTLPIEFYKFLRLSLMNKDKVALYDKQFFGEKLANAAAESNYQIEENIEDVGGDAGNAEIYHIVDQYLFNNQDHEYHELCHLIYTNIQEGDSMQDFNNLILDLKNKIQEDLNNGSDKIVDNLNKYIVTLVAQSICIIGSRSLSVIEGGALELCGGKLRKVLGMKPDEEDEVAELENDQFTEADEEEVSLRQAWLIEGVLRLWNNEPRIGFLILEKMRNKGFLKSYQLLEYLFKNNENLIAVTECYGHDLLERLFRYELKSGTEENKDRLLVSFNESVIQNVNLFTAKVEFDFDDKFTAELTIDQDDEIKWGLKSLLQLLEMYLRHYKNDLNIDNLKTVIDEQVKIDHVKEYLIKIVGEYGNL